MFTLEEEVEGLVDWRDAASCRASDPDVFFPDGEDVEGIARAKAICATCPVREDCLTFAVELNQTDGIWGGRTPAERRRLRRDYLRRLRQAS